MAICWRVRSRCNDQDFSSQAWERSEVGIWYGAWTAQDFFSIKDKEAPEILNALNALQAQRQLGWEVKAGHVQTIQRFKNITSEDWVVMYVPNIQAIGLARVADEIKPDADHPFNYNGELFKYRSLFDKKLFKLSDLPDAYRLLPSQGQSNVFEFRAMRQHVEFLAGNDDAKGVIACIEKLSFSQMLDHMGASGWESFCFAYLIMGECFVPTGLSVGRTLKDVDIIGRSRCSGRRIIAQCKKSSTPLPIEDSFANLLEDEDVAYYFSYGGVSDHDRFPNIKVLDRAAINKWTDECPNGIQYKTLFLKRNA